MRNRLKKTMKVFIITLCIVLSITHLEASDLQIVDVFNNKTIGFKQVYKEVKSSQVNVFGETEVITYIPENSNTSALKQISSQLLQITNSDWNNEISFLQLFKEAKTKINVYLELINSQNSRNDYGENDEENKTIPRLKEIECKPVSISDQLIWYRIEYTFGISRRERNDENEIKLVHYYTADMLSGKLEKIKNNLNQVALDNITKKLVPYFTHDYLIRTEKLSPSQIVETDEEEDGDEDYYERIHRPMQKMIGKDSVSICQDLCQHLNFSEASFYLFAWGIVIEFPQYSESSKVYGGDAFSIFMPYTRCELLRPYLPEIYFPRSSQTIKTSIKDFNEKMLFEKITKISNFPSIENVVAEQKGNQKIKSIFIKSFQLFKNDQSNYRGLFSITLDSSGKIISRTYENEQKKLESKEVFHYDRLNRLVESKKNNGRKNIENHYYNYDEHNNLMSHFSYDENSVNGEYFFYNNNFVYRISINNLELNFSGGITNYEINKSEITFGGLTYVMNEKSLPIGMRKAKYSYQQFSVGHDAKGRIVESHFENDRRNCYFDYDKNDRLSRCQSTEYQNPTIVLDYYYDDQQSLPVKYIKNTLQNNILEKEEYAYEFYE